MEASSATRGQAVLWLRCHLALQTKTFEVPESLEGRGGDVKVPTPEGRRFSFLQYIFENHAAPNQNVQLPPRDLILYRMSTLS